MFDFLFGKSEDKKTDLSKVKSLNQQAEVGLQELANKLGQKAAQIDDDSATQQRFLARLRKEGSGR